eukprot:280334_1
MALLVKEEKTSNTSRDPYPYDIVQDDEKYHELTKYSHIASKLHIIRQLHLDCVHYEALDEINKLKQYIQSNHDHTLLDSLNTHPRIITIQSQLRTANGIFNLITSTDDDWTLTHDDGQWTTEYKHEKNTLYHSFRLKGIGDVKMMNIIALFFEMDLIQTWMPLSKETYEISQLSMFVKCGYFRIGAIWPIQDRECVLFGFGVDDLKRNNRLLVVFDTNHDAHKDILDKFNIKLPPPQSGRVTVDITIGGFLLERVENEDNKTKISVVWNVDPKVYLPATILNWFTGRFAGVLLSSIFKRASEIDKEEIYRQRMR